jgi:uncharacterized hydrophobic protein (TIGR00341 family)
MAERMVQILLPAEDHERALAILEEHEHDALWAHRLEDRAVIEVLVRTQEVEGILDELSAAFPGKDQLRAAVVKVESSIPSHEERAAAKPEVAATVEVPLRPIFLRWLQPSPRISRDELSTQLARGAVLDDTYILMVLLSSVVAIIGLERGNAAIIIGAMVIAPLLGPNLALSVSTTLGKEDLFAQAMRTNVVGVLVAFTFAFVAGLFIDLGEVLNPELAGRTQIAWGDIGLALASGTAGALALIAGSGMSLVGVMVAVALLPPLVTFGLLLAAGRTTEALGALALLATNIVCVNLSSVATFLVRGIRPKKWWEAKKSVRFSRLAMVVWIGLLLVVAAGLAISEFLVPNV